MAGLKPKSSIDAAAAIAVAILLALAVTYPALRFVSWWGVHDWVQFYTYYGVPQRAVAEFHELPGWNPYFYGGNVQWGHPDDPTLSPLFLPMLLFGVVAGVKIDLVIVLAGGMLSMWLLARRLGLSRWASFFASTVWGLNGWHAYHFAVGHCDHYTFTFQPLAVYFFLRAIDDLRWGLGAAAVIAFMYLSGGPYPMVFTIILLAVLALVLCGQRNSARPLRAAVSVLVFAVGFMAVKLVSSVEFMAYAEQVPFDSTGTGFAVLRRALFTPALPMYTLYAGTGYGSWEYAAFIGYIPAGAFLIGAALAARRAWPWALTGAVFLVAAFGSRSPVNFFLLFTSLPGLSGVHVPFRFIVHVLLVVAIVGALGLDAAGALIARLGARRTGTAFVAVNLLWMHYDRPIPLYALPSYLLPPKEFGGEKPETPPYKELTKAEEKFIPITYGEAVEVYRHFLNAERLAWGYDATKLPKAARFPDEPEYKGEAFISPAAAGTARLEEHTLSTYRVTYEAREHGTLILNQNYAPGWRAAVAPGGARDVHGLVGVPVPAGKGEIVFQYRQTSLFAGAIATVISIIAAVFFAARPRTQNA